MSLEKFQKFLNAIEPYILVAAFYQYAVNSSVKVVTGDKSIGASPLEFPSRRECAMRQIDLQEKRRIVAIGPQGHSFYKSWSTAA